MGLSNLKPLLNLKDFETLATFIKKRIGIHFTTSKKFFLEYKYQKICQDHHLKDFESFFKYLKGGSFRQNKLRIEELVENVTTNHTYFYREPVHFHHLQEKSFPTLRNRKEAQQNYRIRMWCACSSCGQEAYTLSILANKYFRDSQGWKLKIVASDISKKALDFASKGQYSAKDLENLPEDWVKGNFSQTSDESFEVMDFPRQNLTFQQVNLIEEFPFKEEFDIIFLRNVMIYFDPITKQDLIQRIARVMRPKAYLYIGVSELLDWPNLPLRQIGPGIYQK